MPVYEYVCDECEKVTEALRKMADADAPQACEHCGSGKTHRTHSLVAAPVGSGQSLPVAGGHVHSGSCGCGKPRGSCGM